MVKIIDIERKYNLAITLSCFIISICILAIYTVYYYFYFLTHPEERFSLETLVICSTNLAEFIYTFFIFLYPYL